MEKDKRMKQGNEKNDNKQVIGIFFFPITFVYYEFLFRCFVFEEVDVSVLLPLCFGLAVGLLCALITSLFIPKVNRILIWIVLVTAGIVYCGQRVYHSVFKTFLSPTAVVPNAGAVTEFFGQVLRSIWLCSVSVILFALPMITLAVLIKKKEIGLQINKKHSICLGLIFIMLSSTLAGTMPNLGEGNLSPYSLLTDKWIQEYGYRNLGVAASVSRDLLVWTFGEGDGSNQEDQDIEYIALPDVVTPSPTVIPTIKITPAPVITQGPKASLTPTPTVTPSPSPTPTPVDTSPNIMKLDFQTLAEAETNPDIKKLHEYFASAEPTKKNEYTGMFRGYNLIELCAEAFYPYLISEELTPTLYRMYQEGFQFTNYYEGVWFSSTSDGEYLMCTGLYPQQYQSMAKSAKNDMYFCLGNQFRRLGYDTYAYHNHKYDYYDRHLSHPNMGYTYKGEGNGLAEQSYWPESDLVMMQETLPDYIQSEQFHAYYMTVSGHKDYLFSNNYIATKNKDKVEHLEYSEPVKAYIACNLELEAALAYLVEELETAGVLDKTVIVLTADHYPYGLTDEEIVEFRGAEFEVDLDMYRNSLLIWNSAMKEPIPVDKPCSNVDVLPTLSNLFGLTYDSRLLMGNDIMADEPGLVLFNNWSYITELATYSSREDRIHVREGVELPDGYAKTVSSIISNRFDIATMILDYNYYSYLPLQ